MAKPKARAPGKVAKAGKASRPKYAYEVAPDVQADLEEIVRHLPDEFSHVDVRRVVCFRSRGSTASIYARIWSLPGIWQAALGVEAHYVIEVVERYDRSSREEREKTLIHELLHIPKTFSGALVPHNCFGKKINCAREDEVWRKLCTARAIEERARLTARALLGEPAPHRPTERLTPGVAAASPAASLAPAAAAGNSRPDARAGAPADVAHAPAGAPPAAAPAPAPPAPRPRVWRF